MDFMDEKVALFTLTNFSYLEGLCYVARLPLAAAMGSSSNEPMRSTVRLFEDGRLIGPPHTSHSDIIGSGKGAFSHWGDTLYFSSSDGTDPASNGRKYSILVQERVSSDSWSKVAAKFEKLPDNPRKSAIYRAVEEALEDLYPLALMGEDDKLYWNEHEMLATYKRLCGSNRRSFERKFAVVNLLKLTLGLPGEVAECGVYEGATSFLIASELRRVGLSRRVLLFDSFQGLSVPGAKDGDFWTAGGLTAEESKARENMSEFQSAEFYCGWIPERFDEIADCSFALVHIDVDLYQPTFDSLEFFYPRMVRGGLIICDDYGFTTCPGARTAMDEFLADKPEPLIHLPTGQGFILKQ
jgi:hypothetical protein